MYFVLEDSSSSTKEPDLPKPAPRRHKLLPNKSNKNESSFTKLNIDIIKKEELPTGEGRKLEHLNKNRAKRANVKKPTRNNETSVKKIETVELNEVLVSKEDVTSTSDDTYKTKQEPLLNQNPLSPNIQHNDADSTIQASKNNRSHNPSVSTTANKVEQPKVR